MTPPTYASGRSGTRSLVNNTNFVDADVDFISGLTLQVFTRLQFRSNQAAKLKYGVKMNSACEASIAFYPADRDLPYHIDGSLFLYTLLYRPLALVLENALIRALWPNTRLCAISSSGRLSSDTSPSAYCMLGAAA